MLSGVLSSALQSSVESERAEPLIVSVSRGTIVSRASWALDTRASCFPTRAFRHGLSNN
jgi:hypothetical protein